MTRILLADDHAVVRQGLKQILLDSIRDATFGQASSGEEVLEAVRTGGWDILILDISLPGMSGLEVLKELRKSQPLLPVLVLSMHSEQQFAVRALRAGAAGYVTKRTAAADLAEAARKVLSGGRYVSASLAALLVADIQSDIRAPHDRLSDREYQVFRMLALGHTVKEISEELDLSPQTISTHRSRILEKMQKATNADLTEYALANRLID